MSLDSPTFTIAVDTREQLPYLFPEHDVERVALPTGDYSLIGYEERVCIERKRPLELFACVGRDRERFEAEMQRMEVFDYAAIVIEGTIAEILEGHPRSRVVPASVVNSLLSWSVRYGVCVFFCGSRAVAERLTLRLLERFWRYRVRKQEPSQARGAS